MGELEDRGKNDRKLGKEKCITMESVCVSVCVRACVCGLIKDLEKFSPS